jgi:predicted cupin superfamily sugar epimerase
MTAHEIIELLNLKPLPEEGGFYRETLRDTGKISNTDLPTYSGNRNYSTCIYYLITPDSFSKLHSVRSTEVFHFYAGDPVKMLQIDRNGEKTEFILGNDLTSGQLPQNIVQQFIWQGTKLLDDSGWALLGCTVSPGFEFEDYQHGSRDFLLKRFPDHEKSIIEFT